MLEGLPGVHHARLTCSTSRSGVIIGAAFGAIVDSMVRT